MAKVEIDEAELAALQSVNKFATSALANPKTRKTMLGIQKTLNPDAVIPEIDAAEGVMLAVNEVKEQLSAVTKQLQENRESQENERRNNAAQERVQKGQKYLRDNGYQEDGIAKIEELMLSEGIASYAAGMTYFEKLNPPSMPADNSRTSPFGSMSDNQMDDADMKELWDSQGQSDQWLQKSLAKSFGSSRH